MHIAYVTLAALIPVTVVAAPINKSASDIAGFVRGAPIPKWVAPSNDIPITQRTDPVVLRLADTQAWVGTVPAISYQRAIQVNDSSSLGVIGQFSIDYFSQYQKLLLHKVVILRGDQRIDRTATVNIRPLQRETNIDNGMLGGATTLQLLLDDVRIGDTLLISYTIEGSNPVFGKNWSSDFSWDSGTPIELKRLTVFHPRNRQLHWRQLGDFQSEKIVPQIDIVNDTERIRFESRSLEAVEYEPSTPADFIAGRVIQFSEYQDWQGIAQWANELFPTLSATTAVKALVTEFGKQPGKIAQAEAALHWVQNEIRYFSVSIGENSHRPQAPDIVLKRRYGDCKDKSYLLVSLLRELGITAKPVLLSADAPKIASKLLATPTWFNHVIVQITLDGHDYYVDPTRTNQPEPLATMPTAFPQASALVVDSSSRALTTLPERAEVGPRFEHIEDIVVTDFNGGATLESHDIYRGNYADAIRMRFPTMSANEQKKYLLAYYEKNYASVTMTGAPQYIDSKSENRIEIISNYQMPKAVSHKDKRYAINYDSQVITGTIGIPDKLVRNFPFELASKHYHGRYRLRIHWPETVRVNDPLVNETLDNPFYRLHQEYALKGNQVDYLMDFQLKQDVITAADLPHLQEETKKLNAIASGEFNINESIVGSESSQAYSFRNVDDLKHATFATLAMPTLKSGAAKELDPEEACRFIRNVFDLNDIADWETTQFTADLVNRLKTMKGQPGVNSCLGELAFLSGNFDDSAKLWHTETKLADDHPFTRNLAWSQLYNGDIDAALATMARYQSARKKSESDPPSAEDAANQIAFFHRAGKALPPELEQYARSIPDGPWPRPVLAMQLGLISEDELIKQAKALPTDTKELALNDAWFYIGQERLVAHDTKGAMQAFRWYNAEGIRSIDLTFQAKAEQNRLHPIPASLEAGRSAIKAKNPAGAIAAWQPGAEAGVAEDQFWMGILYLTGEGVPKNIPEALRLIRLAADQELPEAITALGLLYMEGTEVTADPDSAISYYQKAAELGSAQAQKYLGNCYRYGQVVKRDMVKARYWFHLAAEQGNSDAMASLAEMYRYTEGVQKKDFEQAEFWNRRAVYYGNSRALFNLAYAYEYGESVSQNYERAAVLYNEAAKRGNIQAQIAIGSFYEKGRGVKRDYNSAFNWYSKAADSGNDRAQLKLGQLYETGHGVTKNITTAIEWFRKSAAQGNTDAMVNLGYLYENEIDDGKHYAEAKALYEKAAEKNNEVAEYNLAKIYEYGKGVPIDLELARQWYQRSADQGYPDAQYYLGQMYHNGKGVSADAGLAASWYDKAAQQGQDKAQNELGMMYLNGIGVVRDLPKAVSLLRKAAEQGDSSAMSSLALCYEQGQGLAKDDQQAIYWFTQAAGKGIVFAQIRLGEIYKRTKDDFSANFWFKLAEAQTNLAQDRAIVNAYLSVYDTARAEPILLHALELAEQNPGEENVNLLEQLKSISTFYFSLEKNSKALPYALRSVKLTQQTFGKQSLKLCDPLEDLGDIYRNLHQNENAISLYLQAQSIREKQYKPQSQEIADGLDSMGVQYTRLEEFSTAMDFFRQAYIMRLALFGDEHIITAKSMKNLGISFAAMGKYEEAEEWFQRALKIVSKNDTGHQWELVNILNTLATLYDFMGRYEQSEALFTRAQEVGTQFLGENHLLLAIILNNMGRMEVHHGNYSKAETMLRRALSMKLEKIENDHSDFAFNYQYLGELYEKQQKYADAKAQFLHALMLREKGLGTEHSEVAETLESLGSVYNAQGNYSAAEPLLQRALAIQNKILGIDHPQTKITLAALADTFRKTNREVAAADLERQSGNR